MHPSSKVLTWHLALLYLVLHLSAQAIAKSKQKYYVKSASCQMPYVDPFSPYIMKVFHKLPFVDCHNDSDLITSSFDFDRKRYRLHIHEKLAIPLLKATGNLSVECTYSRIYRNTTVKRPDETYIEGKSHLLHQDYLVPRPVNFMETTCYERNETDVLKVLQRDGFSFVQDRLSKPQLNAYAHEREHKPSVIILGLDSTSRINVRRSMPKVFKYVSQPGWYELQGYNKVGDNTFPNLMAVLTGYSDEGSNAICNVSKPGCLNRLPFIWQDYKRANYTTAYAEDCADISTFNYLLPGFVKQPTDYYLRHFTLALERKYKLREYLGKVYCVGRRLSFSYVYDFAQQFVERFVNETSMFGFFWSNSFTHDYYNAATSLDALYRRHLAQFEAAGLFERSIVLVMSDHGHRYNEVRRAPTGYYEERMPMLFVYLPPWFRARHPQLAANLATNRNRLASNFDLYMTLRHVLQLNVSSMAQLHPRAHECPNCQSLLFPLPIKRSCAQAGIPEHWCTCQPAETITEAPYAHNIAQAVVQHMNKHLVARQLTHLCANYTLKDMDKMDRKTMNIDGKRGDANESIYILRFKTLPNSPEFEASIKYNNHTGALEMDVDEISRLDSYEKDARCINQKKAKKYCICKSAITNEESED